MNFNPIHNSRLNYISFGPIDLTGSLSKDGYFQSEPSTDLTSTTQDAGSYSQSIAVMPDQSGLVTIQLDSQSPNNITLANVLQKEQELGTKFIHNITIDAVGTNYIYEYIGCHIHKRPSEEKKSGELGSSTWVFHCALMRSKRIENTILNDELKIFVNSQVDSIVEL